MTEILTQLGIENVTAVLAAVMAFIGICAFLTSLVTEGLKNVKKIDALPTKLVCYIVAVVITTPVFLALMAFMDQVVEWYMVFASFLTSFVVAKVATSGWDDVTELAKRMLRN
jgi:hypothetical protein